MAKRLVGYYPFWVENGVPIQDLPLEGITHLNYSFARIEKGVLTYAEHGSDLAQPFHTPNGGSGFGNFGQLAYVKQRYPHLKVLISLAGGHPESFSTAMETPGARARFLTSVAQFLRQWPVFDGVDVDWEFPDQPGDQHHFTLLLEELRRLLPPPKVLSVALGPSPENLTQIELPRVVELVDWATLMTYDFASIGEKRVQRRSAHNTPLYCDPEGAPEKTVASALQHAIASGIPAHKLNMGLAFYGYVWRNCHPDQHGEYQICCNCSGSESELSYAKIRELLQQGGIERYFNRAAQVPFLWEAKHQEFTTYDDEESLRAKVGWACEQGLGGLAIWTISQDAVTFPLLRAVEQCWYGEMLAPQT